MSTTSTMSRPTHKALPLLRSEVSRISHRRLLRILALIFLAGIIVVSAISFFTHRSTAGSTLEEIERNRDQQQQFWDRCSAATDPDQVERRCGPDPATQPVESFDYGENKQYRAKEMLPVAVIAPALAAAGIAFIVGASSGGAEWSSRSMTLQLLWEPRRLRLLILKWLGLIIVVVALAIVGIALSLGLAAITASVRGTWGGTIPREFGHQELWPMVTMMAGRGLVFVAIAATVGYAIAVLVRNTGASLGVAFVYFAVAESAVRLALMRYGTEPFMLSTNTVAFLVPNGLDVPGRRLDPAEIDPRFDYSENVTVHLSNLRAVVTMLIYTALLSIPAAWSFTRRDVG
jgi:hypothetical protein